MNSYNTPFWDAFNARADLQKYGADALLLFALQLRFGIEDVDVLASTSLTEGGDGKKADLIYIDSEVGRVVIAQTYIAVKTTGKDGKPKKGAPSNKASDLNTSVSWLLTRPIGDVPEHLHPHAKELRRLLQDNQVKSIQFWYVHNLPESRNVHEELKTVEHSADTAIKANYQDSDVSEVQALEVGISILDQWYRSISTPILVNDEFTIPVPGGYQIGEANWNAYTTAVPARWLYNVYRKHGTDLLSANVRDYLGSRNVDNNINNGIKLTAQNSPEHFWVFNNGITALVHNFKELTQNTKKFLNFKGISIVNGGQTIGAIGSLESPPDNKAMVHVRFITCNSAETVYDIVRYNNNQNKVVAPDFRSKDPVQTKLTEEFKKIPQIKYVARRGGYEDVIKRQPDILPSITAGQALAAFHGDPGVAYHKKTNIWVENELYIKYFNPQTTAKHVLLAYSLLRSVENKKLDLINKSNTGKLIDFENTQLDYFRKRGSTFLLAAAIAKCMEIILDKPIPNLFSLIFKKNPDRDKAIDRWGPIVEAASAFASPLSEGLADGFKTREKVEHSIQTFQSLVISTKAANAQIYAKFAKQLV